MTFGQKVQEFLYSLSTNDKYAEYDPRKSFNRVNKPDEAKLLYSHHNHSATEFISGQDAPLDSSGGVHEVKLAWRHIKNWLVRYSPDLNSSLQDKCTASDLNDFQKDLNIKLPPCVVEFYTLTDGQSNFGTTSSTSAEGLVFGLKLMSLDEIVIMTENWRKVARVFNDEASTLKQSVRLNKLAKVPSSYVHSAPVMKKFTNPDAGTQSDTDSFNTSLDLGDSRSKSSRSSSASSAASAATTSSLNMPPQRAVPPDAIHKTFAHPMWIPIISDEVGNHIGIDLAPPASGSGTYGQVILFGREFDTKYKVADNFGDFLLIFANDLEIGNWDIKTKQKNNYGDLILGSEGSLVFMDKETKMEINYLDILKKRSINAWLTSLQKAGGELDDEAKQLIIHLKHKDSFILDFKSGNSIDDFINQNISSIDTLNQPLNSAKSSSEHLPRASIASRSSIGSTSHMPNMKSPLSQDVTDEVLKEIDLNRQQDTTNKLAGIGF